MSIAAGVNHGGCNTIDIMMSHDWPRGIAYHGDLPRLLQRKPFFRRDIETGELGSPANEELLNTLRPRYWFAAHLHVKFDALVRHNNSVAKNTGNGVIPVEQSSVDTNEIEGNRIFKQMIDSTANSEATTEFVGLESNNGICPSSSNVETLTEQMTRFLSLDKCLPKRRHIQITHLEPSSSEVVVECNNVEPAVSPLSEKGVCDKAWLEYDATWLAILRRTHGWTNPTRNVVVTDGHDKPITKAEIDDVVERVRQKNGDECTNFGMSPLAIPQNFVMTVPPFDPSLGMRSSGTPPRMMGNPQTDIFMDILGLEHRITVPYAGTAQYNPLWPLSSTQLIASGVTRCDVTNKMNSDDTNEIDLDDDQGNVSDIIANDAERTTKCNENEIGFNLVNELTGDRRGSDAACLSPLPNNAANEAKKARTDYSTHK
jgi:lariat debranching enzyme